MQTVMNALQLEDYAVENIVLTAAQREKSAGQATVSVTTKHFMHKEKAGHFLLKMEIRISAKGEKPVPYEMKLSVLGKFKAGKDADMKDVLENMAPSILYGAMRDFVATLTSRSVHGKFLLPAVSFSQGKKK